MEPTTSSRDAVTTCDICHKQVPVEGSQYSWSPFPDLIISRNLCTDCGGDFVTKTKAITDWVKAQAHTKFIDWERTIKLDKHMTKNQLKIPGV